MEASLLGSLFWVSIPFKRESGSKECTSVKLTFLQFQFVSIPFKRESGSKEAMMGVVYGKGQGFNSLQTGKRIQSMKNDEGSNGSSNVSIPFKRESGSKEFRQLWQP